MLLKKYPQNKRGLRHHRMRSKGTLHCDRSKTPGTEAVEGTEDVSRTNKQNKVRPCVCGHVPLRSKDDLSEAQDREALPERMEHIR